MQLPPWCFHPAGNGCLWAVGGFVLVACGPMLSIGYMMARRNDRGMSAVIANPWAHWQYTPEKWAQWAENQREWEKAQEGPWSWKGVSGFVLLCAGLFALGALFTGASLKENAIIVGGLTGFIILLALVAYWFKRTNFDRRYRQPACGSAGSVVRRRGRVLQRDIYAVDSLRKVSAEGHRRDGSARSADVGF